jgi:hypothetical protein
MKRLIMVLFFMTIGISFGAYSAETLPDPTDKQVETHQENYVPGMGEIMGAIICQQKRPVCRLGRGVWNSDFYKDEILGAAISS